MFKEYPQLIISPIKSLARIFVSTAWDSCFSSMLMRSVSSDIIAVFRDDEAAVKGEFGHLFLSRLMINISRRKEKGESRYLIEPSVSLFSHRMIYSLLMCDFLKRHSASCTFGYKCSILMCNRNIILSVYF